MGGRLIVCVGRHGEQLIGTDGKGPLASLVPGTFKRIVTQRRLSYVEIKKRQLEGRHRYTATELTGSRGFTDTYLKTGVVRASQNLDLVV